MTLPPSLPILKDVLDLQAQGRHRHLEKMPIVTTLLPSAGQLIDEKESEPLDLDPEHSSPTSPPLLASEDAKNVAEALRKKACPGAARRPMPSRPMRKRVRIFATAPSSLAYGAKILLNQTHLRLKRGQRYGLLGPNGSGKSTLMRAINNEQVEGFPKKTEVKTVFVEHDLDSADTEHDRHCLDQEEACRGWHQHHPVEDLENKLARVRLHRLR